MKTSYKDIIDGTDMSHFLEEEKKSLIRVNSKEKGEGGEASNKKTGGLVGVMDLASVFAN